MHGRALTLVGLVALVATSLPAPALAQYWGPPPPGYERYRGRSPGPRGDWDRRGYRPARDDRDDRDYPRGRGYPRRCDRGTGGTILGAIAGGLLGNAATGRGDRELGTIVGAGAGALAGRAIDRDC